MSASTESDVDSVSAVSVAQPLKIAITEATQSQVRRRWESIVMHV